MTSDEEKQYRKSAKRITNRIGKYIDETFGVSAPKIKTNKQMTPNGTPGIKSKRMNKEEKRYRKNAKKITKGIGKYIDKLFNTGDKK